MGLAQCHSFTLIGIRNKQILLNCQMTRHFEVPDEALHEIQVRCLIDNSSTFQKKWEAATASRVGVGEAVPDHTVLIH